MMLLTTPYMRNPQLQTFTEEIIGVSSPSETLKVHVDNVRTAFTPFCEGMKKGYIRIDRKVYDQPRDLYGGSFFDSLAIEKNYPDHTAEQKVALDLLCQKVSAYNRTMIKLPLDEETAVMGNMLEEIDTLDLTSLENTGVVRWVRLMAKANAEFKQITTEARTQVTEAKDIESASQTVKALMEALNDLFRFIFAKCITEPTEELIEIQKEIATRIESYSA